MLAAAVGDIVAKIGELIRNRLEHAVEIDETAIRRAVRVAQC